MSEFQKTETESEGAKEEKPKLRLANMEIDNEITALNVMVQFLGLAQKRGAFTIDESAKIWECVKMFQRPDALNPDASSQAPIDKAPPAQFTGTLA